MDVALEGGGDVVAKPACPSRTGSLSGLGVAARGDDLRERLASMGGAGDAWDAAAEEILDEAAIVSCQFVLGQRSEADEVDAAGERLGDSAGPQQVRRSGQQESPRCAVAIDCVLDLEDEIGDTLDLVDDDGPVDVGDEAARVALGALAGHRRVKAQDRRRVLVLGDAAHQRALSDLPGSHHHDDGSVAEGLDDPLSRRTVDDHGCHHSSAPGRFVKVAPHIRNS